MIEVQKSSPPSPERARIDIGRLNEDYIAAVRRCDPSWFQEHMSEEVVVIQGNGRRVTKIEFVRTMKEQPRRFRALRLRNVTVRAFGTVAQVDADAPWQLETGEEGISRYIDTYAWLDGRWQVISAQVTSLPPERT
jgi:ketosteroid isomerase-like protein